MKNWYKKISIVIFFSVAAIVAVAAISSQQVFAASTCYQVTTQFADLLLSYAPAPHVVCTPTSGSYYAPTCTATPPYDLLPVCVDGSPGPGNYQVIACVPVPASDCATISVTVTPTAATVETGETQQFTATVDGSAIQTVTWDVNGIMGGNATLGTIDATGLYTAPASVPSPATVTVTATSVVDPSASSSGTATVVAPPPTTGTVVVTSNDSSGSPLSSSWTLFNPVGPGACAAPSSCSGAGTNTYVSQPADPTSPTPYTITPTAPAGYTLDPSSVTTGDIPAGGGTVTFTLVFDLSAPPPPPPPPPPAPTVTVNACTTPTDCLPAQTITAGDSVSLAWSSTNAVSCGPISWAGGSIAPSGIYGPLTPASTITYSVTCTGSTGETGSGSAIVTVKPISSVSIYSLLTSGPPGPVPINIPVPLTCAGGSGSYDWSSTGSPYDLTNSGSSATISYSTASQPGTYLATCDDSKNPTDTASTPVTITPSCTLTASPSNLVPPEGTTLSWSCPTLTYGGNPEIEDCALSSAQDPGVDGPVSINGTVSTTPSGPATYTLTCLAAFGAPGENTVTATTTVTVGGPGICETNPNAPGCP